MSALISRRPHSPVAARVRRFAAVLTAAGAGLLAWVAAVPAASAAGPLPFGNGATSPARPALSPDPGGRTPGDRHRRSRDAIRGAAAPPRRIRP